MLMKACAENGESSDCATPRAHSRSVERSLERIGDEGASQAGWALRPPLALPFFPSVSRPSGLLLCGGAGELIIGAVKPPHSLVSVSNEVPAIKAP